VAVIDRDLVRAINSGRCFALVGSGLSCEMGALSWRDLAQKAIDAMGAQRDDADIQECQLMLERKEFPKVFSVVQRRLGKQELHRVLHDGLTVARARGSLYDIVSKWPFASYVTTNFDDLLLTHLRSNNLPVVVRKNSVEGCRSIRADTKNVVWKLHGDFAVPQDIVLTEEDYAAFRTGPDRQYWRDTLMAVLKMVNVVIFGYSTTDPDFKDQMERAKQIASPMHPIYMFACGFRLDDIRIYYQRYNIRIIPYENTAGDHRELQKLLVRYDPFIAKRGSSNIGLEPADESAAEIAASMYIFTQTRLAEAKESCLAKAYEALVLQVLGQKQDAKEVSLAELSKELEKKAFASSGLDPVGMQIAVEQLHGGGLVHLAPTMQTIQITAKGLEIYHATREQRALVIDKFNQTCLLFLQHEHSALGDTSSEQVIVCMKQGLVRAFAKRGLEIARSVFSDTPLDIADATDILELINRASDPLATAQEKSAFCDLMIEVLLRPDDSMKTYLATLSQGYFAFHALGLDPRCSSERLDSAKAKLWILDSSVLLPLLAVDCVNHQYSKDLLAQMLRLGFKCCTTERLFDEIVVHARFAALFLNHPSESSDLYQAAKSGPGYRQNLFLDGFIKWGPRQGRPVLREYMEVCLGSKEPSDYAAGISSKIQGFGINVLAIHDLPGFSEETFVRRDDLAAKIKAKRQEYETFRSEDQCLAEAEVVLACESGRAVFLSQSSLLNRIEGGNSKITWKPEAMYRFMTLFAAAPAQEAFFYACMLQDFYYSGFDIVDQKAIEHYAGPMIRQARMQVKQERAQYETLLGKKQYQAFSEGFERVPDDQKPFYSIQFAYYIARREGQRRQDAERQAGEAVRAATRAERSATLSEKEREALRRKSSRSEEKRRKSRKDKRRKQSGRK